MEAIFKKKRFPKPCKRMNVPIQHRQTSIYTSALHIGLIAFALMASIFVIAFATFSSAHAFNIDDNKASGNFIFSVSQVEGNHKLGLVADPPVSEIIPNIEETAFNSIIIRSAVNRIKESPANSAHPIKQNELYARQAPAGHSMSNTARYITIGFLASLFALMMWVTAKMWRDFARSNSLNRRR